jgi:hypothetical protein
MVINGQFVHNNKIFHKYFDSSIDKMATLITYKMGGIAKPNNNNCINKLNYAFTCVILKRLSFYPLSNIVCGYYNILIISIFGCCSD